MRGTMDKIGHECVSVMIAKMDKEFIREIAVRLRRHAAPLSWSVLVLLASLGLLTVAARRRRRPRTETMAPEDGKTAASWEASRPEPASRPPASLKQRRSRVESPPPAPVAAERTTVRTPLSDISIRQPITEADVLRILNSDDPMQLKGIGEISAAKILKYRSQGEDLDKVDDLVAKVGMTRGVVMSLKRAQGIV
jgi:hypothetical protein